jgi:hypothetical protein
MLLTDSERLALLITTVIALANEATKGSMNRLRELEEAAQKLQADREAVARIAAEP